MKSNSRAAALALYEQRYKNASYQAAQTALLNDLFGDDFDQERREQLLASETAYLILNLLIDSAQEICGLPEMQGKALSLLNVLSRQSIRPQTIRAFAHHLQHFEDETSNFVADWEHLGFCFFNESYSRKHLQTAIRHSSDIHSIAGNNAYALFCAAEYLLRAARACLEGDYAQSFAEIRLSLGTLFDAIRSLQKQSQRSGNISCQKLKDEEGWAHTLYF